MKGKDWRVEVHRRNNFKCVICGRSGTKKNPLQVHHIKNKCRGGNNSPSNTTSFCKECHASWHQKYRNSTVYPC